MNGLLVPFNIARRGDARTVRPEPANGTWTTHAVIENGTVTGVRVAFGVERHEYRMARQVFGRRRGTMYTVFVRNDAGNVATVQQRSRPTQRQALDWIGSVLRRYRDGWLEMASAPKNATWVLVQLTDGRETRAHWAQDLSGSEQPPFSGWFEQSGDTFYGVEPRYWKPAT